MFKRICIPKLLIIVLPVILLLLSACSAQNEVPASSTQAPTEKPDSTVKTSPTVTPLPDLSEAPTDAPEPTEAEPTEVQPTEVEERPDITIKLPEGDAERGKKLALKWRCITCHVNNGNGPAYGAEAGLPALLERAEMRISDAAYTGFATTPEEYIIEAIIDPSVYIAEGEWEYEMDDIYNVELSEKDLADIIAWLLTVE
jgi:cytochrome c553